MNDFASLKRVSAVEVRKIGRRSERGMGFDTRIDTFMGEICAILKIRCQDQDQAQEDLLQEGINMHSEKTTIRLVAVDMDGTLLHDDKSISDYTLDVLRRIVKKGVILVPASGRPIGGMKEAVLNNVDGIQYAICSNGAMLMDVPEEKSICETGIPTEKAVEAIAYLEQFPVAVYAIQTKVLSGQRAGRKQGFLRNILISGSAKEM